MQEKLIPEEKYNYGGFEIAMPLSIHQTTSGSLTSPALGHQTVLTQSLQMLDRSHQDVPWETNQNVENLTMLKKVRKHSWIHTKVKGLYSGLSLILHPSFEEIRSVVFG